MSVAITRLNMSATELRREAARLKDARAARRLLAIALVLEGSDRTHAAEACGMDRQTLTASVSDGPDKHSVVSRRALFGSGRKYLV